MLKRQRVRRSKRTPLDEELDDAPLPSFAPITLLTSTPWWALVLTMVAPMAAVALCGSRSPSAMGLAVFLAGACMLAVPARCRLPFAVSLPLALMVILALGSFMPESASSFPEWRKNLHEAYGIVLPATHSPQPWVSLQGWLLLAAGTFWLTWTLSRGFDEPDRRRLLQALSFGICLIAIISLVAHYQGLKIPLWTGDSRFTYYGPFTNRNNFSGLLAPGAVLAFACTYDAYNRKRLTWIVFALSILPIFAAVLSNTSRMGVVLLFVGLGSWMLSGTFATKSAKRFAVSTSLLLILATGFFIYGRGILERFTGTDGIVSTLSNDGRIQIYHHALAVLLQSPWFGHGLGNFEFVYSINTNSSDQGLITRALHPESDWLWLAFEGGVLVVISGLVAAYFTWKNFGSWKKADGSGRHDRRLRAAAGVGVMLILVQGLVDTPMHTLGLTLFGALLAGLAWHPSKRIPASGRSPTILRYAGSGFCMLCGALWLIIGTGDPILPGTFSAKLLTKKVQDLSAAGNRADALIELNKVIAMRPLQWDAYYIRAALNLQLGRPHQLAMDDFARARALEPNHPAMCMQEALIWLDHAPLLALPALREAIRRDPRNAGDYYRQMVSQIYRLPELRDPLRAMAENAKLRLIYLESASAADFQIGLRDLLDRHPSLENLTGPQKLTLFELWYSQGDREVLVSELLHNPTWRTSGWIVLARHFASLGKFREACELAFQHLREPLLPDTAYTGDLSQLNRGFLQNPNDALRGLALYRIQRKNGLLAEALATLRDVTRISNVPAGAWYEYANRLVEQGDYSRAWDAILTYQTRLSAS